ncbi:MAG: phosphoadenylyl-sulfate reductase [Candidatus Thiodiazotropha sp.]
MNPLEEITLVPQGAPGELDGINRKLEGVSAEQRVEWTLGHLRGEHILTSSFGIQGAVMLHLVTRIMPDIPVVLVDTGYLFAETYSFIDQLTERLNLNLQVYRAEHSPAWQESRYGRLWEQGLPGIEHYNRINKVDPLQRALKELRVGSWFAGLRRQQSQSRSTLPVVRIQDGRFKVHPVVDWHSRDVHRYLQQHNLPYHPLWDQGYASVGDIHTSRPLELGMHEEETRFFGLKRECGIHE